MRLVLVLAILYMCSLSYYTVCCLVCLSVCPSHSWIPSKRINISSSNERREQNLFVSSGKSEAEVSRPNNRTLQLMYWSYWKTWIIAWPLYNSSATFFTNNYATFLTYVRQDDVGPELEDYLVKQILPKLINNCKKQWDGKYDGEQLRRNNNCELVKNC